MAENLAFDAGRVTAQAAVARIRRILNSQQTDTVLAEILYAAESVLKDIPPQDAPPQPELHRAANRPPITNSDYLAKRRRQALMVIETEPQAEVSAAP